ncbi:hypothetical protein [Bradyrhizobium sp. SZCCHNR1015]|uniref:hypothetical protein n=1 Tax=Bradyrhizobium sp. SZCCHNR1015 TaxID=3057338 RepID=UPI00291616EB|nr:hypothetical protein [Bradyrhizobium sp. SZCCHNR1015]
MSPFFHLSDKGRDAAQKVVVFSLLVVFFSGFKIQLSQVPILNIPLPAPADNPGHELPSVASIFLLVAIFQAAVLLGIYLGEYSNYIDQADQKLTVTIIDRAGVVPPEQQAINAGLNRSREANWKLASIGSALRFITDLLAPFLLVSLAGYLEFGHSIRSIYQML